MSIKLGTDFDLKSKQFLDSRQGLPKTKTDLKEWSTPVPPGFEVCLEKVWYYYDPSSSLPDTGHWVPRLVGREELEGEVSIVNGENRGVTAGAVEQINTSIWVEINNIKSRLDASADAEAGYKISNIKWGGPNGVASGTTFEIGDTVNTLYNDIPTISYNITGKNNYAYPENNGRLYWTEGIQSSYSSNISKDISYLFTTPTENQMSLSATASLSWTYRRFWGAVTDADKSIILAGGTTGYNKMKTFTSGLSTSGSITNETFNCTGGKYPFFAVYKSSSWSPTSVTVGGFANSNYTVSSVTMINTFGVEISYRVFMLNQIQTASNIKLTIEG